MDLEDYYEVDDEDVIEELDFRNQKDGVLFCIDASQSMLEPNGDSQCAAWVALETAYIALQQRIISQPSDAIGIILFGTSRQSDPAYEGCYLLMDLDVPDAAIMRQIKDILEDDDEFERVFKPSPAPVPLANMFFFAGQQFTSKLNKYMFRRLFLITNNDNPHEGRPDLRKTTHTRVQDLYEIGVRIEPFFLSSPKRPFDTAKFYEDVLFGAFHLASDVAEFDIQPISSTEKLQIQSHIKSKQIPRHAIFSIPLHIVPGKLSIGIKGYVLFKRQEIHRSHFVYNYGGKQKIVKGHSEVTMKRESEKVLKQDNIENEQKRQAPQAFKESSQAKKVAKEESQRGFKFGGSVVPFTHEEIQSMRSIGQPGISIIGFKPSFMLDPTYNIRSSYFIYPSEEDYVGSIRTFAALHASLISENKIAVAWMKATVSSSPLLCALIACPEILESVGGRQEQKQAPGIYVIRLPFADDQRDFPEPYTQRRTDDRLVKFAKGIITAVKMPRYDAFRYQNPALQWHYRILQALALEEELPAAEDTTVPKYNSIHNRAGEKVLDWGQQVVKVYESKR
ncbi:SPOC like C-terminal domain-containing protein [Lipomyces arxii]|uniref:SPOC like C-terminal domain-containing protein n=1 Tax=Lipomyces arxii TaxID=56418 RepID=UPI0034CE8AE5